MLLGVAWAEYMSFTQSRDKVGYVAQVNQLTQQKKAVLEDLQTALVSAQPDVSLAQQKGAELQDLEANVSKLNKSFESLLADARTFIKARMVTLKEHAALECDRDVNAEHSGPQVKDD